MLVNYEDILKEMETYEKWHFKNKSTTIAGLKKHFENHLKEQTPTKEKQQLVIVWQSEEGYGKGCEVLNDVCAVSSEYNDKTQKLELTVEWFANGDCFNTFMLDVKRGDFFILHPLCEEN